MRTARELGDLLVRGSKNLAQKAVTAPTGVTPGYNEALGGTVGEDGRLTYVRAVPGAAPLTYGTKVTPQTLTGTMDTIDYDSVSIDPGGMVTTGGTWRCLLPTAGWYVVHATMVLVKNSNPITLGEWWQLSVQKGAYPGGSLSTLDPGGYAILDRLTWQTAVGAGDMNGINDLFVLSGSTYLNANVAPADFYFTIERSSAANDRDCNGGHFFVARL